MIPPSGFSKSAAVSQAIFQYADGTTFNYEASIATSFDSEYEVMYGSDAAIMLRGADESMRGRVMGVRMLAIWGLPLGLVAAGPLIEHISYSLTVLLYCGGGLLATLAIGYRWRHALWLRSAAANAA